MTLLVPGLLGYVSVGVPYMIAYIRLIRFGYWYITCTLVYTTGRYWYINMYSGSYVYQLFEHSY